MVHSGGEQFGTGQTLAAMADQFGQLVVSLTDGATSRSRRNGWWNSRSAEFRGLSTPP
jgi:hypothetical protein